SAKLCPVQLQGLLILERAHPPQPTALLSQEVYYFEEESMSFITGRPLMFGVFAL
ncbi:hypothetical protein ACVWZX_003548, partial [Deinococcus sp. UYEF24]